MEIKLIRNVLLPLLAVVVLAAGGCTQDISDEPENPASAKNEDVSGQCLEINVNQSDMSCGTRVTYFPSLTQFMAFSKGDAIGISFFKNGSKVALLDNVKVTYDGSNWVFERPVTTGDIIDADYLIAMYPYDSEMTSMSGAQSKMSSTDDVESNAKWYGYQNQKDKFIISDVLGVRHDFTANEKSAMRVSFNLKHLRMLIVYAWELTDQDYKNAPLYPNSTNAAAYIRYGGEDYSACYFTEPWLHPINLYTAGTGFRMFIVRKSIGYPKKDMVAILDAYALTHNNRDDREKTVSGIAYQSGTIRTYKFSEWIKYGSSGYYFP